VIHLQAPLYDSASASVISSIGNPAEVEDNVGRPHIKIDFELCHKMTVENLIKPDADGCDQ
jgi:hypothetical protein